VYRRIFYGLCRSSYCCNFFYTLNFFSCTNVFSRFLDEFLFFKFLSFLFFHHFCANATELILLCCCGDQFVYLFFNLKVLFWKKEISSFSLSRTQKICEMRGVEIMPQENIMAPHDLGTKKNWGLKIIFCFLLFFVFKVAQFLYTFLFFNLVVGRGHNEI